MYGLPPPPPPAPHTPGLPSSYLSSIYIIQSKKRKREREKEEEEGEGGRGDDTGMGGYFTSA